VSLDRSTAAMRSALILLRHTVCVQFGPQPTCPGCYGPRQAHDAPRPRTMEAAYAALPAKARAVLARHRGPCGANIDRRYGDVAMLLVCRLPRDHAGDHNTSADGGGDVFARRFE
jgi:hypothetical protein